MTLAKVRGTVNAMAVLGCGLCSVAYAQSPAERFLNLLNPPTDLHEVFETNGYRIESLGQSELGRDFMPNGNSFDYLEITAEGIFRVGVEKGRAMSTGGSVGVYHSGSRKPMLVVADEDGDGLIDILTYSVLDESGEKNVIDVIDYEADGQADMRIHFAEKYFEIWHEGAWRRREELDGKPGIFVDGEFVEIANVNNRWIVL